MKELVNMISASNFRSALWIAIVFAVTLGALLMLKLVPWEGHSWQQVLLWAGSAGCLGFLVGGVYAFDPKSGMTIKSSAIGRMSFGLVASLLLSALWRWPLEGIVLAGLIGTVLGYFGMLWAKYLDHF
jgi:hypothetical protein